MALSCMCQALSDGTHCRITACSSNCVSSAGLEVWGPGEWRAQRASAAYHQEWARVRTYDDRIRGEVRRRLAMVKRPLGDLDVLLMEGPLSAGRRQTKGSPPRTTLRGSSHSRSRRRRASTSSGPRRRTSTAWSRFSVPPRGRAVCCSSTSTRPLCWRQRAGTVFRNPIGTT